MRGVNMTTAGSKSQAPKARKRVDVDPSLLKRSTTGSAFSRCEKCKKDIAVATFDMHDCNQEAKTKAITSKMKEAAKSATTEIKKSSEKVGKKRKGDGKEIGGKKANVSKPSVQKPAKDPNMPKRPPSAFLIFMETFRKDFKQENPDSKGVAAVGKAGGVKWKEMSGEEKAPYNKEAAERKANYENVLATYNKSSGKGDDEAEDAPEESDKSKSEVQEEEAGGGDDEEE